MPMLQCGRGYAGLQINDNAPASVPPSSHDGPTPAATLGLGRHGRVVCGSYSGVPVAVKLLHPSLLRGGGNGGGLDGGMCDAVRMTQEMDVLRECRPPNIIALLGAGGMTAAGQAQGQEAGGATASHEPVGQPLGSLPAAQPFLVLERMVCSVSQLMESCRGAGSMGEGEEATHSPGPLALQDMHAMQAAVAAASAAAARVPQGVVGSSSHVEQVQPSQGGGVHGQEHLLACGRLLAATAGQLPADVGNFFTAASSMLSASMQGDAGAAEAVMAAAQAVATQLAHHPGATYSAVGSIPPHQALSIACDVAAGLAYLHPILIHRDIKPSNMLLDAAGTAKFADFGLARMAMHTVMTAHPQAGTAPYVAPECWQSAGGPLTHKSDIYAFGMLLYELLTGEAPWQGMAPLQVALACVVYGMRPLLPDTLPPRLAKLLAACWAHDPACRPDAADILKQLTLMRREMAAPTTAL